MAKGIDWNEIVKGTVHYKGNVIGYVQHDGSLHLNPSFLRELPDIPGTGQVEFRNESHLNKSHYSTMAQIKREIYSFS